MAAVKDYIDAAFKAASAADSQVKLFVSAPGCDQQCVATGSSLYQHDQSLQCLPELLEYIPVA